MAGVRLPVDGEAPQVREVDVLVRPENVTVSAAPDGDATVVSTSFLGSVTRVHVDHAGTRVKADLSSREATALTPGARVALGLAPHPVLVAPRARR